MQPGTNESAPSDWGVRFGISKKIGPQGITGGEAINRALEQATGSSGTMDASTRSELLNTFSPEQLKILNSSVRDIQRGVIDSQLGITTGTEKYGFGLGVDVPNVKQNEDGTLEQRLPNPNALGFAKNYANALQQQNSTSFTNY